MKFPIQFPQVFGWANLAFGDRLKLMAFLAQLGAGIAMTVLAGYALYKLAWLKAIWPVFYLGFGALILIGIVMTGFAGLLIKRTLEVQGPGGFVFKSQDSASAQQAIDGVTATARAVPAEVKPEGTTP